MSLRESRNKLKKHKSITFKRPVDVGIFGTHCLRKPLEEAETRKVACWRKLVGTWNLDLEVPSSAVA